MKKKTKQVENGTYYFHYFLFLNRLIILFYALHLPSHIIFTKGFKFVIVAEHDVYSWFYSRKSIIISEYVTGELYYFGH